MNQDASSAGGSGRSVQGPVRTGTVRGRTIPDRRGHASGRLVGIAVRRRGHAWSATRNRRNRCGRPVGGRRGARGGPTGGDAPGRGRGPAPRRQRRGGGAAGLRPGRHAGHVPADRVEAVGGRHRVVRRRARRAVRPERGDDGALGGPLRSLDRRREAPRRGAGRAAGHRDAAGRRAGGAPGHRERAGGGSVRAGVGRRGRPDLDVLGRPPAPSPAAPGTRRRAGLDLAGLAAGLRRETAEEGRAAGPVGPDGGLLPGDVAGRLRRGFGRGLVPALRLLGTSSGPPPSPQRTHATQRSHGIDPGKVGPHGASRVEP